VAGTGSPGPGTAFTVEVDCDVDAYDQTLVFGADGTLTSGTLPMTGLPVGMDCTVTETGTGGADPVRYDPDGGTPTTPPTVTIAEDQLVTVTVTNTFDEVLGSLDVVKVIGAGPEPPEGAVFTVEVDCDDDTFDTTLRFDETGTLISGTAPLTGLPVGTECTVTETGVGGASGVVYEPHGTQATDPPTVTIGAEELVTITVTNTFTDSGPGGITTVPDDDDDDDDGGTGPATQPGDGTGFGDLARTGVELLWPVALAAALLAGGQGLLTVRRRLGDR